MSEQDILQRTIDALEAEGIKQDGQEEQTTNEKAREAYSQEKVLERELTSYEKECQNKGWDPEGPKSAEEWDKDGELYKEIKERGYKLEKADKKIAALERTINSMKSHMDKQAKAAYEQAKRELEANLEAATSLGQTDQVKAIVQQQKDLEEEYQQDLPEPPQAAMDFQQKYEKIFTGTDFDAIEISEFVRSRDQLLFQRHQGKLDPDEHFRLLEEQMLKKFPDYFGIKDSKSLAKTSIVESGRGSQMMGDSKHKKYTFRDLDSNQKQIAKDFERIGLMTVDEYIKQLIDLGELK